MNLYLIGYRGTGKTTLGQAIGLHKGWPFVDMDNTIVAEAGRSIAQIVQDHGWERFRELERALLQRLAVGRRQVVGTGGGVVLSSENVALMRATGRVIWLRARVDTIRTRLAADPRSTAYRPALTDQDRTAEIENTLRAREPLYRAAMHLCVDTDDRTIEEIITHITEKEIDQ